MKIDFSEVIHHNRDENSFTARLFEYILFPLWFKEKESCVTASFDKFINILQDSSERNYNVIQNKYPDTNIKTWKYKDQLFFKDAMLFLEVLDINHYCKTYKIEKVNTEKSDRTEFDCVVLCEDKNRNEHIIVFEVKCYTDLKCEEICRQNKILIKYDKILYDGFHHFALISYDNLHNAVKMFDGRHFMKCPNNHVIQNGLYIVTWDDFKKYMKPPRFSDTDVKLYKKVSRNGNGSSKRHLVNNE